MNFKERYSYDSKKDLLGEGGFSTIYLATDNLLGRKVALKFFPVSAKSKYSVLNEIRKVINLDHPNIARFHDAVVLENVNVHGDTDRIEIGVMEHMDGGDLKNYLQKNSTDVRTIAKLLVDILQGLDYLHAHGIIHRDLKPQNILVKSTPQGPVAKLTDFGISKAMNAEGHSSSALLGSIEYMAPEQFNPAKFGVDGKIATNVDLWSFGIMAYEVLCGTSLFGTRTAGHTTEQVMNNILQKEITEHELAHLPEPWKSVIRVCIIKNANVRVRTARELLSMIEAGAAVKPVSNPLPPFQQPPVLTPPPAFTPPPAVAQPQQQPQQQVPQHTVVLSNAVNTPPPANQQQTQALQQPAFNQYTPPPPQQGRAPKAVKSKLPLFLIGGGALLLVLVIIIVVYVNRGPRIAESVREAMDQYAENPQEGLKSLRYWSATKDSASSYLATIYYNNNEFDSARLYMMRLAETFPDTGAFFPTILLQSDPRLGGEFMDIESALYLALRGKDEGIDRCEAFVDAYCSENNLTYDNNYNLYSTASIGDRTWMTQNLNTFLFSNGEEITQVTSASGWWDALERNEPAWCYYNFDDSYSDCGKIYNVYAVNDYRGLAPAGWRIPNNDDWEAMATYGLDEFLSLPSSASADSAAVFSGKDVVYAGYFSNEWGFTAKEETAIWWSASISESGYNYTHWTSYIEDRFYRELDANSEQSGYFVRCVK